MGKVTIEGYFHLINPLSPEDQQANYPSWSTNIFYNKVGRSYIENSSPLFNGSNRITRVKGNEIFIDKRAQRGYLLDSNNKITTTKTNLTTTG